MQQHLARSGNLHTFALQVRASSMICDAGQDKPSPCASSAPCTEQGTPCSARDSDWGLQLSGWAADYAKGISTVCTCMQS